MDPCSALEKWDDMSDEGRFEAIKEPEVLSRLEYQPDNAAVTYHSDKFTGFKRCDPGSQNGNLGLGVQSNGRPI